MHPLVEKTIKRALSGGGKIDVLADFDAIQELERLARAATEPPIEERLVFLDLPIRIGPLQLYRLSWGALDWVADCAGSWWSEDGSMYDRALAWAHAHARSPRAFRRCADLRTANAEILRWVREQSSSWEAIMSGVDSLMTSLRNRSRDKSSPGSSRKGDATLFDTLINEYGKDLDYWIWEISAEALTLMIEAHRMKLEKREQSLAAIVGKAPDPSSNLVRHTIAFQRAAKAFVKSHTEGTVQP